MAAQLHLPYDAGQAALEAVLRSRGFAGTERRRRLLQYLVEQTISGKGAQLKEFNIGIEVYGRDPALYDPRIDPVVRVDIGRLRTKLTEYYETEGRNDPVRIELPKGSYAVGFHRPSVLSAAQQSVEHTAPAHSEVCAPETVPVLSRSKETRKWYVYAAVATIVLIGCVSGAYLLSQRLAATVKKHTSVVDPEAYNLFQKTRGLHSDGTRQTFDQTVTYLNQAIRRDPTYADAYAALAGAYASAAVNFAGHPLDYAEKAKAAAETAIRLDPASARAYAAEGLVDSTVFLDWRRGEQELRKAVEIAPQDAGAHSGLRVVLTLQGRFEEAIAEGRTVTNLEPLSAGGVGLGLAYYMAREYDAALAEFIKARELHPEAIAAHVFVGMAWEAKGEFEKAMAEYQLCLPKMPETKINIVHLLAVMGKQAEARKMLAEIERERPGRMFNAFDIACVYAALGDRDQAFKWLDRAYDERAICALKVHPMLEPVRGDPRFAELLKKAGLAG